MGIGEALITLLDEKGIPTPLVHTMLCSPRSRMDVLTEAEISSINASSKLVKKYSEDIDSDSAYEMLNAKLKAAEAKAEEVAETKPGKATKEEPSAFEKIANNSVVKSMARTAGNGLVRSLLGVLGMGGRSSSRAKKTSWF